MINYRLGKTICTTKNINNDHNYKENAGSRLAEREKRTIRVLRREQKGK